VFIAIVLVLLLYAGIYLVWDAANVSLDGSAGIVHSLTNAFLRPDHEVFFILRSLLVIALVYVIADYFLSTGKRAIRRRKREAQDVQATFTETASHAYRDSS
jgi:hypothetical protein